MDRQANFVQHARGENSASSCWPNPHWWVLSKPIRARKNWARIDRGVLTVCESPNKRHQGHPDIRRRHGVLLHYSNQRLHLARVSNDAAWTQFNKDLRNQTNSIFWYLQSNFQPTFRHGVCLAESNENCNRFSWQSPLSMNNETLFFNEIIYTSVIYN